MRRVGYNCPMKTYPQFPPNFYFGSATAAYQIEGGWNADGKGPSTWDTFVRKPGKIKNGDTGDVACNTYHDFQTDIDIMAQLNMNAYRFSTAWSRILPDGKGTINQKGLDYYSRFVDALLEKEITPFVTLFHWDMPQALQDEYGGFASRETAVYFADYVELVVTHLGDRVKHWITLNEPWEHAALGYLLGEHAPGKTNPWTYFKVAHHQLLGHGLAMARIKSIAPDSEAGITLSITPVFPQTDSKKDQQAALMGNQFMNDFYLDGVLTGTYPDPFWSRAKLLRPKVHPDDMAIISHPIDFLGLNYYSREQFHHAWYVPFFQMMGDTDFSTEAEFIKDGVQHTAMGWEVYPDGLYNLLMQVTHKYDRPVLYVTENGAAFTDVVETDGEKKVVHDPLRQQFLQQYMGRAADAIRDGADLRGYFIWSLIDNFEWATGYSKRFGLIHVDHTTQERVIKDSGYWYRDLIQQQTNSEATNA